MTPAALHKKPIPGERNASCQGATRLSHLPKPRKRPASLRIRRTRRGSLHPTRGLPNAAQGPVPTGAGARGPGAGGRPGLPSLLWGSPFTLAGQGLERWAAGGVPDRNLTSLVPISEALQSDIDCDLHLLVYTNVLQPLSPTAAPRATLSGAAPAAAGSRRPRGDAARPGHGPEAVVTARRSGQACWLTGSDRDSRRPVLDRSHQKASRFSPQQPRRRPPP